MIDLKRYMQLKGEVDRLRSDADRASGTLAHLLGKMKERFGCGDLEQAEAKLAKMDARIGKAERELASAVAEFETEWESQMGEDDA